MGMEALKRKGLLGFLRLSTANTSTTLYISKLIYIKKKRCDEDSDL